MTSKVERAWAEVNLCAISQNLRLLRRDHPGRAVIPVVKADAYGHGAVEVARRLEREGADMLAVVSVEEGQELRRAGIETPILLLGAYTADECLEILEADLTPSVSSWEFAAALDTEARRLEMKAPIHVEVDTGMGRLGVPDERAIETIEKISVLGGLVLDGIYTHFAESECEDKAFTLHQVDRFRRIIAALGGMGVSFTYQHAANSAACLEVPESVFNCLRPGISLYGIHPDPCCSADVPLEPALKFCARVVLVEQHRKGHTIGYNRTHRLGRDSRVAVISAGYADGYDRRFSDKALVTVGGATAPVLGRVSMDLTSVDVTDIPGVKPGDEAVLFSNDPAAPNCVERLAALAGTIPHVLTCGISKRVRRTYRQ